MCSSGRSRAARGPAAEHGVGPLEMRHQLCAILVASATAGCMPWPHSHYRAPAVEGVIMNNGAPVQDAEIRVSAQFSDEQQKGITDSNGRFKTKPIREFMFFASLLGDPLYGYSVTITQAESTYEGFGEADVGYASRELNVACDLSKPTQQRNNKKYCVKQVSE